MRFSSHASLGQWGKVPHRADVCKDVRYGLRDDAWVGGSAAQRERFPRCCLSVGEDDCVETVHGRAACGGGWALARKRRVIGTTRLGERTGSDSWLPVHTHSCCPIRSRQRLENPQVKSSSAQAEYIPTSSIGATDQIDTPAPNHLPA